MYLLSVSGLGAKNLKRKKKKRTVGRFLHIGPKKGVEKGYKVYFAKIRDSEIRHTFLSFFCQKLAFFCPKKVCLISLSRILAK